MLLPPIQEAGMGNFINANYQPPLLPPGTSPDEPAAQECGHGDEGGLPEATRAYLPQDLYPKA